MNSPNRYVTYLLNPNNLYSITLPTIMKCSISIKSGVLIEMCNICATILQATQLQQRSDVNIFIEDEALHSAITYTFHSIHKYSV